MSFEYLASPYSHQDERMQQQRYESVVNIAATLWKRGRVVYSPIAHTHPIALAGGMDSGFENYRLFDEAMVISSTGIIVATIEGWIDSYGVQEELEFARKLHKPIFFYHCDSGDVLEQPPAAQ